MILLGRCINIADSRWREVFLWMDLKAYIKCSSGYWCAREKAACNIFHWGVAAIRFYWCYRLSWSFIYRSTCRLFLRLFFRYGNLILFCGTILKTMTDFLLLFETCRYIITKTSQILCPENWVPSVGATLACRSVVHAVLRKEWLVFFPINPALNAISFIILPSLLTPIGWDLNQRAVSLYFVPPFTAR